MLFHYNDVISMLDRVYLNNTRSLKKGLESKNSSFRRKSSFVIEKKVL